MGKRGRIVPMRERVSMALTILDHITIRQPVGFKALIFGQVTVMEDRDGET